MKHCSFQNDRTSLDGTYIAAEFPASDLPSHFILGDNHMVGQYLNKKLDPDQHYKFFLRAYTSSSVSR